MAVILPPKIYYYEPKIFGFKLSGKRGSKYFNPPRGNVHYVEDSMQGLELEELHKKTGEMQRTIPEFGKLTISDGKPAD